MLHARISIAAYEDGRREPRTDVRAKTPLREFGKTAVEALLVNISSNGFQVETAEWIAPGARIWLTLPGVGRTNALVRWARSGRIGGEFAAPIDPLMVIHSAGGRAV